MVDGGGRVAVGVGVLAVARRVVADLVVAGGGQVVLVWSMGGLGPGAVDHGRVPSGRLALCALLTCPVSLLAAQTLEAPRRACLLLLALQALLVLAGRVLEGSWLYRRRLEGHALRRTLVVMGPGAEPMMYQLRRFPGDGLLVVGYLSSGQDRAFRPPEGSAAPGFGEIARADHDTATGHAFGAGVLAASPRSEELRNRDLSAGDRLVLNAPGGSRTPIADGGDMPFPELDETPTADGIPTISEAASAALLGDGAWQSRWRVVDDEEPDPREADDDHRPKK